MDRRKFVGQSLLYGGSLALLGACKPSESLTAKYVKDPFDVELVREFVYWGHSNPDKVKEMHTANPHLLNATVDWGDGDFESALGAAGHVGNTAIANYLIEQGARMDIFAMAMLGMTAEVQGIIARFPSYISLIGPHGFTLLHHAGIGVESPELVDWLQEKGLTEKFVDTFKK